MGKVTLITGGARSGKSSHALTLAAAYATARRAFIATAEARDDEMRERIERHRAARPPDFLTLEEPRELVRALGSLDGRADIVVVDCLTLWLANLIEAGSNDDAVMRASDELVAALLRAPFDTVVATDEVGAGIVPNNQAARRFRDLLGWTNQRIARAADNVVMMVAGIAMKLK
ncbi:MAG: bifunctional adenosylcobinamide kinase/adenosylcobinamide-phosphate guanylyltransferase [Candidatus Binataceae bacterium]